MCGRYRLSRRKQLVEEYFDVSSDADDWNPRFNIAPTQPVPVIRQHPKEPRRVLSLMRWGLIPSWAKDASGGAAELPVDGSEVLWIELHAAQYNLSGSFRMPLFICRWQNGDFSAVSAASRDEAME